MARYQVEMARVGRSRRDAAGRPIPVEFEVEAETNHEIMDRLAEFIGPRLASSGWTLRLEWSDSSEEAGSVEIDGGRYGGGTIRLVNEPLECLDSGDERRPCSGEVEYRMPLSATGRSFPRCEAHWTRRLDKQSEIDRRYPYHAPSDFDPAYAGERWDED